MAKDSEFYDTAFSKVKDDFVQRLLSMFKKIQKYQYPQLGDLVVLRTDYMMSKRDIKMVEFNTFSPGAHSYAEKMTKVHRHIQSKLGNFDFDNMLRPKNDAATIVSKDMISACKFYSENRYSDKKVAPVALFIVDEDEWNIGCIYNHMNNLEKSKIQVIRASLPELVDLAKFENENLYVFDKEIALVYFRTGYRPNHYTSEEVWKLREDIEISKAIKCPSLGFHLLTFKSVQLQLSDDTVLNKLCENEMDRESIRSTFAFTRSALNQQAVEKAKAEPNKFILKEQSEGGSEILSGELLVEKLIEAKENDTLGNWLIMRLFRIFEKKLLMRKINIFKLFYGQNKCRCFRNFLFP